MKNPLHHCRNALAFALLGHLSLTVAAADTMRNAQQIIETAQRNASTNRMIIKLRPSAGGLAQPMSSERINTLMTRAGQALRVLRRSGDDAHVLLLDASLPNAHAKALARKIAEDPAVEYAQPDYRMYPLAVPNDLRFNDQWYLGSSGIGMNMPAAWDITIGSENIVVAVLDTGIVPHSDISGARLLGGYDFISADSAGSSTTVVAGDGNGRDPNPTDAGDRVTNTDLAALQQIFPGECSIKEDSSWHGTQIASIIGAATNNGRDIAGVDWRARILSVRVLGRCGGFTSDIIDAARWAAGLPVTGVPSLPATERAQVLNLSLGVSNEPCGAFEQAAINEILQAGVVKAVVTAAGNERRDAANNSPGSCLGVVNVAGVLPDGGKAFASNFGDAVTLGAAYGVSVDDNVGDSGAIYTLGNAGEADFISGDDIVNTGGGTSFSAALTSGVVALMLSVNPNLTASQVFDVLRSSAKPYPSRSNCRSLGCGAGTLDARAAIAMAQNSPPAPRDFPDPFDFGGSGGGGGGCSVARGAADASLALLLLMACGYFFARRRN